MSVLDYFRPKTKERLMRGEHVHWIENNNRSGYIRTCVLSYPPWVDRAELQKLWQECRDLELETGVPHNLDHIIPLNHPKICGLSVPWNMRAIPASHNNQKGNTWNPDQLSLFEGCEL